MVQFVGMLAAIGLTALCWGAYGPVLRGPAVPSGHDRGGRMRASD